VLSQKTEERERDEKKIINEKVIERKRKIE
jgi:hypothetical protein